MKTFFSIVLLFCIINGFAQNNFSGKLEGWNGEEALIIKPDFMGNSQIEKYGLVKPDGSFNIDLDVVTQLNLKDAETPEDAVGNWVGRQANLNEAFSCFGGELQFKNAEQAVYKLSTMGSYYLSSMNDTRDLGYFMSANSLEFVQGFSSFGEKPYPTGFMIDYYYVAEPAKVNGECAVETYTISGELYLNLTKYKLDLKPGWNIVKFEVAEIFTDNTGMTHPAKINFVTEEILPQDAKHFYFRD